MIPYFKEWVATLVYCLHSEYPDFLIIIFSNAWYRTEFVFWLVVFPTIHDVEPNLKATFISRNDITNVLGSILYCISMAM